MLEVDARDAYEMACGSNDLLRPIDRSPFAMVDTTDKRSLRNVCRRLVDLQQAFGNLQQAIRESGDSVMISVSTDRGDTDGWCTVASIFAACLDGMSSGEGRTIFLKANQDDRDAIESAMMRSLGSSYDTSSCVLRSRGRMFA